MKMVRSLFQDGDSFVRMPFDISLSCQSKAGGKSRYEYVREALLSFSKGVRDIRQIEVWLRRLIWSWFFLFVESISSMHFIKRKNVRFFSFSAQRSISLVNRSIVIYIVIIFWIYLCYYYFYFFCNGYFGYNLKVGLFEEGIWTYNPNVNLANLRKIFAECKEEREREDLRVLLCEIAKVALLMEGLITQVLLSSLLPMG